MRRLVSSTIILLVVVTICLMASIVHDGDVRDGITRSPFNLSQELNWNSSIVALEEINYTDATLKEVYSTRLNNMIKKSLDWFGYVSFESVKTLLEFGYTHPEYNYRFMFNLLRTVCWIMFIWAVGYIVFLAGAIIYIIVDAVRRRKG